MEELECILREEVLPACGANLFAVAGVWSGFDPHWLEETILRQQRSPWRRLRRFLGGRLDAGTIAEWEATKAVIDALRAAPVRA